MIYVQNCQQKGSIVGGTNRSAERSRPFVSYVRGSEHSSVYNRGAKLEQIRNVLAVELRDALLKNLPDAQKDVWGE